MTAEQVYAILKKKLNNSGGSSAVVKNASEWSKDTSIISKGEICIEQDEDGDSKIKIGDGKHTFLELNYIVDDYYTQDETKILLTQKIADSFYVEDGYLVMPDLSMTTSTATNNNVSLDYTFVNLSDIETEHI